MFYDLSKDELKALNWPTVEKKEGNCIGFEAGETVYVDGAPLKIRNGLVQVRPPHCAGYPAHGRKKKYWTALGLLGAYDKESTDKKKGNKKGKSMTNKKYTDQMKAIAAKRFPDAYPQAVTKVIANGKQPEWQSDAQKFIKPEKDVIFAWGVDGQGERSFRYYRVPTTVLPKLLQKNLEDHPQRLRVINGKLHDLNSTHKYTSLHVSKAFLDELGLSYQRLE